tara:strand:+ start:147 stop:248 length:102 start_codon:yes stop_codon:yes gene_type:complete
MKRKPKEGNIIMEEAGRNQEMIQENEKKKREES